MRMIQLLAPVTALGLVGTGGAAAQEVNYPHDTVTLVIFTSWNMPATWVQ